MIDPAVLVDAVVSALRNIPDLLAEVAGDPERIYGYKDRPPDNVSLDEAIYRMPARSVMVAWQEMAPGNFGQSEVWKHQISIFIRADDSKDLNASSSSFYRIFRAIWKGQNSAGQTLADYPVHNSFYPMDVPTIRRTPDVEGVDFFEVTTTFTEIGDD
jgi:hypothetical protein